MYPTQARGKLLDWGIDMDIVSHADCENPNVQITLDSSLIDGVSDTLGDVVDTVGDAFGDAAGIVADVVDSAVEYGRDVLDTRDQGAVLYAAQSIKRNLQILRKIHWCSHPSKKPLTFRTWKS